MANLGEEEREFEVPEPVFVPLREPTPKERERVRDPLTEPVTVPSTSPDEKEPWHG